MYLMIHPPRFLCICNYFCSAGFDVESMIVKKVFCLPCVRVYASSTPSLRSFLSATSQASVIE